MAITSNPIPVNTRIATVSNDSDQFPISQGATFNDQKITSKALFLQADRAEIAGKIPKISTPTAGNLPTVTSDGSLIDSGTSLSALSLALSGNSSAISAIKGTGWNGENLVDHEERIAEAEGDIVNLEAKDVLLDERIDNIIASSGTSDTEVVDARLSGSTGVLYTLLKNRLDAMEKHLVVTNEIDVPVATIKFRMSGNQPQLVTEVL